MGDFLSNPEEEYKAADKSIDELTKLLKLTEAPDRKQVLQKEINRLIKLKKQLSSVFEIDNDFELPELDQEAPENELKILERITDRYGDDPEMAGLRLLSPSVRSLFAYMFYFEKEILCLFSEKKMKLDFTHSIERDSFYNKFNHVNRKMEDFIKESERINNTNLKDDYEFDTKLRKQKMQQILYIEIDKFFVNLNMFLEEILEDIDSSGYVCLNNADILHFDTKTDLSGLVIRDAVVLVQEFISEVVKFLNIPEFMRKE